MAQQPIPIDQGAPGSEVSDLQRLVADGRSITFLDGSSARLVLSARSMARIEDRYGSLNEYVRALNVGSGGPLFHLFAFTFSLALSMPEDRIWDLMDTKESDHYLQAISDTLTEALPDQDRNGNKNPQMAPADPSPGAISTMSPSSSGGSIPSASGA